MKGLGHLLKWSALLLFVVFPLVFVLLVVEREPLVQDAPVMNTDHAVKTRALIKQVLQELLQNNHRATTISATEDELNGVFSMAHRSLSQTKGWVMISEERLEAAATFRLPRVAIGLYLNFQFILLPSEDGFHIREASLGKIALPDAAARFLIRLGLDLAFGTGEGEYLLDAVDAVVLQDKRIEIHMQAIPRMNQMVEHMRGRARGVWEEVRPTGDPERVREYYRRIMVLTQDAPRNEALSLGYFMGRLMKVARHQGGDAAAENRSAILALGIYFGSWRVEQMIGPVRTEEMRGHKPIRKRVGLAGRRDLTQHFIISAALKIVAETGVTHAIGEFKELFDARKGGSGFSFADLAADRAGVRFAEVATHADTAARIQAWLSENNEEDQFFPEIAQLPEGISQAAFEQYFVSVENARYLALVDAVDACIKKLPAFVLETRAMGAKGCNMVEMVPAALVS